MPKIDLMIVGAQKAGTTALKEFLGEHPDIQTHHQIEFDYFVSPQKYQSFDKCYNNCFNDKNKFSIAKNASLYHNESAIKNLYNHNPSCKIVFIIREPVSRAISSYNMAKFNGWYNGDPSDFSDVIKSGKQDNSVYRVFLNLGLYDLHFKALSKYFDNHNIYVYLYDDLKDNPQFVCSDIFKKIGVDSKFLPSVQKKYNVTKKQKSKWLSLIILRLKGQNNFMKKFLKFVLPYRYFVFFADKLISLNKSDDNAVDFPNEIKQLIQEYYIQSLTAFEKNTGIFLDKWKC